MTGPQWDAASRPRDPGPTGSSALPADDGAPPQGGDAAPELAPAGPPGGGIFSLEGRRAPGLYLVAWLLSVAGLVLLFVIGPLASAEGARLLLITGGAISLVVGLAAACGHQVLERRDRPVESYRGPSPVLVFLTFLMTFFVIGLFVFVSEVIDPLQPLGFLTVGTLQAIGYGVLVWLFVVRTGALSWRGMGWATWQGDSGHAALRAIGEAAAVMLPVTFGLLVLGGILGLLLDVEPPSVLPSMGSSTEALAVALTAGLIVPVGEELFFRGFSLTAWLRDLGPRSALIRSSVFFALIHVANINTGSFGEGMAQAVLQTAVILPVGLVLGWLFLRRGMAAAIAGHVTYNSLLLFLTLLAPALPPTT